MYIFIISLWVMSENEELKQLKEDLAGYEKEVFFCFFFVFFLYGGVKGSGFSLSLSEC